MHLGSDDLLPRSASGVSCVILFLQSSLVDVTFIVAGWAFADSVLHRLAPLWVGARGLEFTWDYILQGLEANANLVRT